MLNWGFNMTSKESRNFQTEKIDKGSATLPYWASIELSPHPSTDYWLSLSNATLHLNPTHLPSIFFFHTLNSGRSNLPTSIFPPIHSLLCWYLCPPYNLWSIPISDVSKLKMMDSFPHKVVVEAKLGWDLGENNSRLFGQKRLKERSPLGSS